MVETRVLIGRIDNQLIYQIRNESGTPLRNEVVYNGNVIGEMPLTWQGGTIRSPTPAPTVQWQQPQNIAAARAASQQYQPAPKTGCNVPTQTGCPYSLSPDVYVGRRVNPTIAPETGFMILTDQQVARIQGNPIAAQSYKSARVQMPSGELKPVTQVYPELFPAPPPRVTVPTAAVPVANVPKIAGVPAQGLHIQQTNSLIPGAVKPPVGSPFSEYQISQGYWYGKDIFGGLTRLNPVQLSGSEYSLPNEQFASFGLGKGIGDKSTITLQALPAKPPTGSSKEALRAWSESYASVSRANALALGQTPVSEQLLANKLFTENIQWNTPKYLDLLAQGLAGRYKTSQGYYGTGASIPTNFAPPAPQAVSLVQPATPTPQLFDASSLMSAWTAKVNNQAIGNVTPPLGITAPIILGSMIGATAAENIQGGDLSGVQPASQQQSLFSKQYQPSEVTIPFTNISVYPAYEALHGAGEWFTKNISDRVGSGVIATPFNAPTALVSMMFPKNQVVQTMAAQSNAFSTGLLLKAPVSTLEFIGMVPVGAAILAKEPAAIPAAALAGLKMQAQGIKEGITTRPGEFLGEQVGIGLITYGLGEGIKTVIPIKYTGKVPYGAGDELVNYRGVYAESPVASVGKLLGRGLESEGTKNLFGITTEPRSSGLFKNIKPSIGIPTELAREPYLGEGFVPRAGSSVVDVPLVREFLAREGVRGTAIAENSIIPKYWEESIDYPSLLPDNLLYPSRQVGKEGTFFHATSDAGFLNKITQERQFTVNTLNQPDIYPQKGMFFGPRDTVYTQFLSDNPMMDVWEQSVLESGIPDSYIKPPAWVTEQKPFLLRLRTTPSPLTKGVWQLAKRQADLMELVGDWEEFGGISRARADILARAKKMGLPPLDQISMSSSLGPDGVSTGLVPERIIPPADWIISQLPKNKLYPGIDQYPEFVVPEGSRLYVVGESVINKIRWPGFREIDPFSREIINLDAFGGGMREWSWGGIDRYPVVDVSFTPPHPSGLELFDTSFRRLSELQNAKPTTVRNPYTNIERVSVIKPGTGERFINILKEVAPEHKITGTTEQVMFQRNYPAAHDIDILVPKKDISRVQVGMARKYFAPEYGSQNVRLKGTGIEVFKEGNWQTAMDIHDIESHSGMLGFGVRTGVPVEVEGVKFIPLREQLQRKVISEMALRETQEGWTVGPALHRGKEIADTLGALKDQMIAYEIKGRAPPERLLKTYREIKQSIAPGSPLDQIYSPRPPKRSVAEQARLRLKSYQVDYAPTDYTRIPFTNKYYDFGKFTLFEKKYVNPAFEKLGIGFGTRIVDPGAIMEYPMAVRALTGSKAFAYPSASAGIASRPPAAVLSLGPQPKSLIYPTSNPKPSATTGWGGYPTTGVYPSALAQFGYIGKQSAANYFGVSGGGTSPQRYIPSQVTQQKRSPITTLYTSATPTQYFRSTPSETPWSTVPYLSESTHPSRTSQIVTYPGRTPTGSPGRYITTTTKTSKHPPGMPPEKPPKYPPQIPPPEKPHGYPPTHTPEKYPGSGGGGERYSFGSGGGGGGRTTTGGGGGGGGGGGRTYLGGGGGRTFGKGGETYGETTSLITYPKQFLLIEEWPPKTPKLRLHFDVIGSKWNIRNPIPRLGTGAYPKIELKIEDKVYSRDPMRYVEHRPYDKFISWRSGSSWNVKNPVPRITTGGKYPKRELQVSNVNKGRFVSMTPAAVSKKGKVSIT